MNLAENEQDWLARHLGHDIRVHREFYRMHESTVELVKISKLLLASEKGTTSKYKGLRLEDIPETELLNNEAELENIHSSSEECGYSDASENSDDDLSTSKPPKKKTKKVTQERTSTSAQILTNNLASSTSKSTINKKKEDREELFSFFSENISNLKVPGKEMCLKFITIHKCEFNWRDVKFILNARIQKEKRARVLDK